LPTPRTLRLLSDEHALEKLFPGATAARTFRLGQRVEAQVSRDAELAFSTTI
jgi:hypothetical protein